MSSTRKLERSLTGSARFGAYTLLILLAFLAAGCRGGARLSSAQASLAPAACDEGMLAAQAWKCFASGAARR